MDKLFVNPTVKREICAVASKSEAHRALICAALCERQTQIVAGQTNADIDATASCLASLGADVKRTEYGFLVTPIGQVKSGAVLNCNESGSTLRFLLPLAASLGATCSFSMSGRLPSRPLSPMYELLSKSGVTMSPQGSNPLTLCGKFRAGDYSVAANVSSQYISGLLFALSIADGQSTLSLEGKVESAPYIDMTVSTLLQFGAEIGFNADENKFYINGKQRLTSPERIVIGGDWSGGAFFLCAGAIGKNSVTVTGLDTNSRQGDRQILDVLTRMGAEIKHADGKITVYPSSLVATDVNASQIPDLVPIIATVASVAKGRTVIYNASRLRLKESDRIESTCAVLSTLGADIVPTPDGMIINGKSSLVGGVVDSYNDHRIAMSAAIASLSCRESVTVKGFEAINKSYPSFEQNFK